MFAVCVWLRSEATTSYNGDHFCLVCIVFSWDHKTLGGFWNCIRMLNVYTDEIQCFKSLITIHKVLRDGHPNVRYLVQRRLGFISYNSANRR